jgi:hypothetical protein
LSKNTEIKIFYNDSLNIDDAALEKILQSIMSLGDSIYLHSSAKPANYLPTKEQSVIREKIASLIEHDYLRLWDYPFGKRYHEPMVKTDVIYLESEKYNELYDRINSGLLNWENEVSQMGKLYPESDTITEVEGTSKLILLRNGYWDVGIATILNANRLISGSNIFNPMIAVYEKPEGKIVKHLFERLEVLPLSKFSADDILDLLKSNSHFKKMLIKKTGGVLKQFGNNDELLRKEADKIYDKYFKEMESRAIDELKIKDKILKASMYQISGLFVPPLAAALPHLDTFQKWYSKREENGCILFMLELKEKSRKYNP